MGSRLPIGNEVIPANFLEFQSEIACETPISIFLFLQHFAHENFQKTL